jgi:4-amino-4-deoxy-L-arabinose transferase-like glycosyltransferase
VLVIFTRLWETTLASYDDTFYAEKAKEILLTGQWLVPPWDYQPNFDNPPLYFWATAILFRLFGISEFTARFVSAACGVGCIVLTYRFGRRLFGPWAGLFSGFALLTTPYFIKYARHAMLDTTQTLLVGCSLYLLVLGLQRQRTGWTDLAAGVLMGLAVLNKSLLGYLPLAIYAVYVLVARAPLRRALRPGLPMALLAALVLPGTWFAAVIARHGSAPLERHFGYVLWQRAMTGDPGQVVRWTSGLDYLAGLLTNFQPWILLALYGAWRLYRVAEAPRRGLVPIAWAGTVLLLLSLAAAKKSWYVMPAYPALAMLAGVGLEGLVSEARRWRERVAAVLAALVVAYILVIGCTPVPVGRDRNRDVAAIAPAVRAAVPPGGNVICFNLEPHWRYISPLYFYADRPLSLPVRDLEEMQRIVRDREARAILTDMVTWDRLRGRLGMEPPVLSSSGELILLGPLPGPEPPVP